MEYIKIKEAAKIFGIHPVTLRRWEKENKIKVVRHPINKARLYVREDLEKLFNEMKQQ